MRKDMCVHYRGIVPHSTCRRGVPYLGFGPSPFKDWPCTNAAASCVHRRYPTDEELAAHKAEWEETTHQTLTLMSSIPEGRSGTAPCPKCGGTVDWSRSPRNNHLHAKCRTPACLVFIQ